MAKETIYKKKSKLVDKNKLYSVKEALDLVKQTTREKFDESIDIAVKLGVDLKKVGGSVRGTLVLPAGSGKQKRVAVIAKGAKVTEAKNAGADIVGEKEIVDKIKNGFFDFDILIATPDMMVEVGKLGRILGTKGLMPNPKSGTVTMDLEKTVKEFKSGRVEFKAEKTGVIHLGIGRASFETAKLEENFYSVLSAIRRAKPAGAKGIFIKSIAVSSTMGPGIKLDASAILDKLEEK